MNLGRAACRAVVSWPAIPRPQYCLRLFSVSSTRLDDPTNPQGKLPSSISSLIGGFDFGGPQGTSSIARASAVSGRRRSNNRMSPPVTAVGTALPKMGPTAGRSVIVTQDLPSALLRLNQILVQNNVKHDFRMQRFHERPGLKRKRLKALRHRRRFKEGFKKMVQIALDMKKLGM